MTSTRWYSAAWYANAAKTWAKLGVEILQRDEAQVKALRKIKLI